MSVSLIKADEYTTNTFPIPQPFHHFNIINIYKQDLAPHTHDRYHINLITEGSLKVITKDKILNITEGNAYIMPPGVVHQLVSENGYSQIGMDIYDVQDKNGLSSQIKQLCNGRAIKVKFNNASFTRHISKTNLLDSSPMSRLKYISLMTTMLIMIIESGQANNDAEGFRIRFIEAAEKYAKKGVNLDLICKEFNFSKTHIERLAKREFGCSAIKYVEHIRFLNVCSLLTNTTKKLSDIATECGFCDSSHLSVFFKKHCGITPAKFRKEN